MEPATSLAANLVTPSVSDPVSASVATHQPPASMFNALHPPQQSHQESTVIPVQTLTSPLPSADSVLSEPSIPPNNITGNKQNSYNTT